MARVASSGSLSVIAPTKFAFVGVNCGSEVMRVKPNHLIFCILFKTDSASCHAACTYIDCTHLSTQKYELSNGLRGRSIMAFGSGGSCGPSKGPLRRAT